MNDVQHRTTIAKNASGVWCVFRYKVTIDARGMTELVQVGHEYTATDEDWLNLGGVRKVASTEPREPNPDMQALIAKLLEKPPGAFRAPPTAEEVERQKRAERRARAARAGIPALYLDKLTSPQERPAIKAVRAWYKSDKQTLLLSGANQCGKSFAAAGWLSTMEGGRWTTASEIGLSVQPDPEQRGAVFLRDLRGASALVLDNLGERCGPGGYEEIEAQLMHQISKGHRLIVTTDWNPDDVWKLFGTETHNRILARWQLVGDVQAIGPWVGEGR